MTKVIEAYDPHAAWATMSVRTLTRIFIYGLLVGAITYVLYLLVEQFILEPILCREGAALARCESKGDVAAGLSMIIGSFIGLSFLVRERVYRPILAIIGVAISLWGVFTLVTSLPIVLGAIVLTLLVATAYVLFSWIVQPTSLVVSVVGVIVVVVLARVALG